MFYLPILWISAVTLIRSSVILLYIRIFPLPPFRITCYTVLLLNTAFFIATFFNYVLLCLPVWCQWNDPVECTCGDTRLIEIFNASFNLFLDITVVVLPMPIVLGLQMALGRKAMLIGMFGLGIA